MLTPLRRRRVDPEDAQLGTLPPGVGSLFPLPWICFFWYISSPVAWEREFRELQTSAHIPASLCLHGPSALEPGGQLSPAQLACSGAPLGNRRVHSRELVDKSQHGPQRLPCLPSSAAQEFGKVNLSVPDQAPCQRGP